MKINKHIKYLIIFIILLVFFNTSEAAIYENGTLSISASNTLDYTLDDRGQFITLPSTYQSMKLHYKSFTESGIPITLKYDEVIVIYIDDFNDIPINIGGPFNLYDGSSFVGSGNLMINNFVLLDAGTKRAECNFVYTFDDNFITGTDEIYDMSLYTQIISIYINQIGVAVDSTHPREYTSYGIGLDFFHSSYPRSHAYRVGDNQPSSYYTKTSTFENDYSIKIDYSVVTSNIYRTSTTDSTNSKYVIRYANDDLYYETTYTDVNTTHITSMGDFNYYIKPYIIDQEYFIYTSIPEPEQGPSSLVFNQSTYNISECIKFTYTNLDLLESTDDDIYNLEYYYYINKNEIEYLYTVPLDYGLDNNNDIGYTHTQGWTPKKLYYGVINKNVNYKNSKVTFLANVKLSGYVNLSYPYEFITDSCEGNYCSKENGDTVKIIYNVFSKSIVYILDSNEDIVQNLGEIEGFGSIDYVIPFDDNKQHGYPQWNITTLDGDEYDNFMVYWIEQEEYEYYETSTPDEIVQENVDTTKEAIEPIMDLLFGLSTIFVENPDYDDNGIIESTELDQWFNGIISILIIILIYIFYKGLSRR